jgi:hypothetical protein
MRVFVLTLISLVGLTAALVSGYFLLHDWAALQAAFAQFEKLAGRPASLNALFVAEARQNLYRLNCFADGVGVLLGGILAAIGLHGLCLLPPRNPPTR